ncbi:unnamed protein product, partial [Mycena citricolor]
TPYPTKSTRIAECGPAFATVVYWHRRSRVRSHPGRGPAPGGKCWWISRSSWWRRTSGLRSDKAFGCV